MILIYTYTTTLRVIRRLGGEGGERGSFDRSIVQSDGAATERQRSGNGSATDQTIHSIINSLIIRLCNR